MFTVNSHYNPYLGIGRTSMRVVLSLGVADNIQLQPAPLVLAIVLDCSTSMSGEKIRAACAGAAGIVNSLDEQITFMIVTFSDSARTIYGPVACNALHKQQALSAIQRVGVNGGTRMSTALNAAIRGFKPYQQQAKMLLFLTDGQNMEAQSTLHIAVDRCIEEHISIHAWGIGTDWNATELRYMAEMTHGNADIIPTPDKLAAAFMSSFQRIRRTALTDIRLLLWTPAEAVVKQIQQVYPSIIALTPQQDSANQRQQIVSLGSFAIGDRHDYLVDLTLPAHEPGQQFMMLRSTLRYVTAGSGEQEERAPRESWVAVEWTPDTARAAKINEQIAHYTNEKDLAERIQQGNAALVRGDKQQAAELLAQALEMSQRAGNEQIASLLGTMVTRGPDGKAQLKNVDAVARKTLEIKQGSTSRIS